MVAYQPVIVPSPLQFGLETFHQPLQLPLSVRLNPVSHSFHGRQVFLGGRASFDSRFALAVRFPVELKPKKIKPSIVRASIVAKAQRFGFVRCHFQAKFGQPFFQGLLKGFGFVPIFKAHYKIIRIANE